ncbi:MAG: GNAT family N-acetyltransferase [Flavobacteriales bacterium]
MEVTIRPARPEDVPAMLELVRELAVFEKEPEAVTVTEAGMLDAEAGEKPVWWGWVAEGLEESSQSRKSEAGHRSIVGIAVCYERYSTWRGRVGYLEDIVVTHRVHGQGVGEKLFKACAGECVCGGSPSPGRCSIGTRAIRLHKALRSELSSE